LLAFLVFLGVRHAFGACEPGTAAEVHSISAEELPKLVETYKGTPLLLVYWASWCAPCREYREKILELQKLYSESQLRVLGVSVDADRKMFQRHMDKSPSPFPTVIVSEEHYKALSGFPVPTTILYDAEGNKVKTLTGNVSSKRLQHYVKKLF
jgi:thiol-disulfide isomerase/thioredoxin